MSASVSSARATAGMTPYHAVYLAHELTKRAPSDSVERLANALADAQVDLNPHQVDAALFAVRNPLSRGVILADEVGLGKTIEAGLLLAQRWAERKRRLLVIVPANLRKQWAQELADKFYLPSVILETKTFNAAVKSGNLNPFQQPAAIICSYQFARAKDAYVRQTPWDLVVVDEAHRLRNVYKTSSRIAQAIRDAIRPYPKVLLTATPLQNSLLELYGLASIVDAGDIVLDFFAGSGTTAQAVLEIKRQDSGSRKFILVQLPEPMGSDSATGKDRFETIADLCEERVRHVIKKLDDEDGDGLKLGGESRPDRGFRTFKLAQSNVKEWDSTIPRDPDVLAAQLEMSVDHLRQDRTDMDIVYEVLLKSGFALSSKVAEETIAGKRVYSVADGAFLICLDRHLTLELIRAIANRDPERVLVLDEGFAGNDQLKTNAAQTFNTKNITFRTL